MGKDKSKGKCGNESADMRADERINTDPNGSWTGISSDDEYETPIQDADDL